MLVAACAIESHTSAPIPDAGTPSFTLHITATWISAEAPGVTAVTVDGRAVSPDQASDFTFVFPSFADALAAPPVSASVTTAAGTAQFGLAPNAEGACAHALAMGASPVVTENDDYVVTSAQMTAHFDPDCGDCKTIATDIGWCTRL